MAHKVSAKTTFEPSKVIEPIHTGGSVSLDKSGRCLATCVDEEVLLIDIKTGERLFKLEGDGEPITSLVLSPDAQHLAFCSRSLAMWIYSLSEGTPELRRTLKPHGTPVITTAIDESGTLLATGGADGTVKVWDIRNGFTTHNFHGHGGVVSALSFFTFEKGKGTKRSQTPALYLASGSEDGKIKIWDLQMSKSIASLDSHVSVVKSLSFSSHQQLLLSSSRDKTIILWNTKTWRSSRVIPVLEVIERAGFVGDEFCYTGGERGKVRVWAVATGKEITVEQESGSEEDAISDIQEGGGFLLSIHLDQTFRFHDSSNLLAGRNTERIDPLPVTRRIPGNHNEVIDLALVGPDQSLLALATNTESVRIVNIHNDSSSPFGADVALLSGHSDIIICLDVDWSGHWVATGAKDNTARLWRLDPASSSYTCFASFAGHAQSLGAISLPKRAQSKQAESDPLNHPPEYLITGSQDKMIKRWDTSNLSAPAASIHSVSRSFYTRVAHEKDINSIDVSSTAPIFASASQDRNIKIWDLDSGSTLGILRGHKRGVWSVQFAPKDTPAVHTDSGMTSRGLLISGSGDRTVKLWSLNSYACILTFEGHSNSVLKVIWLRPQVPEGDETDTSPRASPPIIASASADTLIKLWSPYPSSNNTSTLLSAADTHLLTTLSNHTDRIWALTTPTTVQLHAKPTNPHAAYSLISGAADSTLTFWTDTTRTTTEAAVALASQQIEQDQELTNHMRAGDYSAALRLALTLNHPGRLLRIFEDAIKNAAAGQEGLGDQRLEEVVRGLERRLRYRLLLRVGEWNASARTAGVAQRVLGVLLRSVKVGEWVQMSRDREMMEELEGEGGGLGRAKVGMGLKKLFRALEVYTERHLTRMQETVDEGFLLEYTIGCMDGLGGRNDGEGGATINGKGVNGRNGSDSDDNVIMLEA